MWQQLPMKGKVIHLDKSNRTIIGTDTILAEILQEAVERFRLQQ